MAACPRHPRFNIVPGVYYRCADPDAATDWVPRNARVQAAYYRICEGGDFERMAGLMGEALMVHSNETSAVSPYVSVASCPACLAASPDPTVMAILQRRRYLCRLAIDPRNQRGAPFIFEMGGPTVGAAETEALVLLPPGQSLSQYFDNGYVTLGYIQSL